MLKLQVFLDLFPEFNPPNYTITEEQFKAKQALSSIYLNSISIATDDELYDYIQGLLVAHLFVLGSALTGNSVKKAESLESAIEYNKPTEGYLSLSETWYGRTVLDYVAIHYKGGYAGSMVSCGGC